MSYRHLRLNCECGQIPARILEVGFTAGHEMVIHFWCSKCSRVVVVAKPLTECWRECPQAPGARPAVQAKAVVPTAEDNRFLQSIGVTFLEKNVD